MKDVDQEENKGNEKEGESYCEGGAGGRREITEDCLPGHAQPSH